MLFKTDLLVPLDTPLLTPETVSMKLCQGTITHSFIQFPAGCSGLVWVQVWFNGHQLIPWERGQWLRGDDHTIEGHSYYPVAGEPRLLIVKGYSAGSIYPHTVQVGVEVAASEVVAGLPPPDELLRALGLM